MIEVKTLRKTYGSREALKGITLSIQQGEFYGLLGPNGAGKTTAISILSSILQPDGGEVIIDGHRLKDHPSAIKNIIGVVPQEIALYSELSAFDNLMFWGSLYKVPSHTLKNTINNLLDSFGLAERKHDRVASYSGGMKRRINIAVALLHQPKVLFMDEPTVGIDPQSRNLIFEVVEQLHQKGMTIVYTTHYMEEAERLCDRIGIIDNGQIIAQGTLDEIKNSSLIKEAIAISFGNLSDKMYEEISAFWQDSGRKNDKVYFYSSDLRSDLPRIILKCGQLEADIVNIEIQKTNLETIFLSLTGKQLRD